MSCHPQHKLKGPVDGGSDNDDNDVKNGGEATVAGRLTTRILFSDLYM